MDSWPWLALALLGVYHGLNPAMGWLFAVALGLQRRSRGAVLGALVPIAVGHEASIAVVVALVAVTQAFAISEAIRPAGDRFRAPSDVKGELDRDELGLYELIWRRTLASQMVDAKGRTVSIRIGRSTDSDRTSTPGSSSGVNAWIVG